MHLADQEGKDKTFLTNVSNFLIVEFTYSDGEFTELLPDFFYKGHLDMLRSCGTSEMNNKERMEFSREKENNKTPTIKTNSL